MTPSTVALAPIHELHRTAYQGEAPLVMPVSSTDDIVRAWNSFKDLKFRLLNDTDFIEIKGERFAKKSAFRKLALAFGISVEITREDKIELKDGTISYLMTARGSSPNGRSMMACASCSTDEKRFNKSSDARAIAQTRATNRSIADLIGWSAPSAEEVIGGEEIEPPARIQSRAQQVDGFQEKPPESGNGMTERQRTLLVSLISQKIPDPEEREDALRIMQSYSKEDASEIISSFLTPQPA